MADKPIVTQWQTIPTITFQEYERYLPTAFDESLSLLQKVNKLVKYVNDIGILLNAIGEQWNQIVEWVMNDGLENAVRDQLTEWLNDGTLANIMSQLIDALPFVNLKQYKEANSLSIDDAFQQCLDFAKLTDDGVHIIIPPSYQITMTREMIVYSNTKITCAPGVKIKRDHDGYILLNGVRGATYTGYSGFGNISIVGGTWDINGVTRSATASGISFAHAKNLSFRDMTILDSNSHHIEVNSSMNVMFDTITCLGFSNYSTNMTSEAIQIDHSSTYDAFGSQDGTHCKNVTWKNCYFGASGTAGTQAPPRGLGSHAAIMGKYHENIVVDNNTFEGCTDYNIQCYNWKKVKIKNNDMIGGRGGIIVYVPYKTTDQVDSSNNPVTTWQDVYDYDISGNSFSGMTDANYVRLYGTETAKVRNVRIHHNSMLDGAGGAGGIYATYFDGVKVNDNNFENLNDTAISVSYGNNFTAKGNTGKNLTTGNGVTVSTSVSNVTIANNEFEDLDEHGILISDTIVNFVISGNRIKNVNRTNGGSNHIRIVTNSSNGTIIGNITTNNGAAVDYPLYITGTNSNIVRSANILRGVGSTGAVYDPSSVSVNSGDLI